MVMAKDASCYLELSDEDQKKYSLLRAISALIRQDWSNAVFEKKCSDEISERLNTPPSGFYLPIFDLKVKDDIFFEKFKKQSLLMQAGAESLDDLSGLLSIPRHSWTANGNFFWGDENSIPKHSIVEFTPKTYSYVLPVTNSMLTQTSSNIEIFLLQDMVNIIARSIDRTGLDKILCTEEIPTISSPPNESAITYDLIVDLETAANVASGKPAYITSPKVIDALGRRTLKNGKHLMNKGLEPFRLDGYPMFRTTMMPAKQAKKPGTNLVSIIFGDWSQLTYARWGCLDISLAPPDKSYPQTIHKIQCCQLMDVQILSEEPSFALLLDTID
jgi:hypothetical protein